MLDIASYLSVSGECWCLLDPQPRDRKDRDNGSRALSEMGTIIFSARCTLAAVLHQGCSQALWTALLCHITWKHNGRFWQYLSLGLGLCCSHQAEGKWKHCPAKAHSMSWQAGPDSCAMNYLAGRIAACCNIKNKYLFHWFNLWFLNPAVHLSELQTATTHGCLGRGSSFSLFQESKSELHYLAQTHTDDNEMN